MDEIERIQAEIVDIWRRLVCCENNCGGVVHNLEIGIPPLCVILESDARKDIDCAVAVVGINPGRAPGVHDLPNSKIYAEIKSVWDEYISDRLTDSEIYAAIMSIWYKHISNRAYHERLRHFVDQIGLKGPILWTELVKCGSATDVNTGVKALLPFKTFRVCTKTYLNDELNLLPADWTLVAAGEEAYKALGYLCPDRLLVGVPHPTAARTFHRLFVEGNVKGNLLPKHKQVVDGLWGGGSGGAVWLSGERQKVQG